MQCLFLLLCSFELSMKLDLYRIIKLNYSIMKTTDLWNGLELLSHSPTHFRL